MRRLNPFFQLIRATIMEYHRVHIRVPIQANATLSDRRGLVIKVKAIDISKGGISLEKPIEELAQNEYFIQVETETGEIIKLTAVLVRQNAHTIGFRTVDIEGRDLQLITELVYQYQETTDFIKQIDEHNIFDQYFIDDDGSELEVTFDIDPPPNQRA